MSREISHSWGRYRIIGKICFSLFSCIGLYINRTDLIKMNQSIMKKYKGTTSQLVWLNIQIHTGSSILEHLSLHIINGSAFSQVERKTVKNYGRFVCHSVVPFLLKNLWYWNSTGLEYWKVMGAAWSSGHLDTMEGVITVNDKLEDFTME